MGIRDAVVGRNGGEKLLSMGGVFAQWVRRLRRLAEERRRRWLPLAAAALRDSGLLDNGEEKRQQN